MKEFVVARSAQVLSFVGGILRGVVSIQYKYTFRNQTQSDPAQAVFLLIVGLILFLQGLCLETLRNKVLTRPWRAVRFELWHLAPVLVIGLCSFWFMRCNFKAAILSAPIGEYMILIRAISLPGLMIGMHFIIKQKIGRMQSVGLVIAFASALLIPFNTVFAPPSGATTLVWDFKWLGLGVGAALCLCVWHIFVRWLRRKHKVSIGQTLLWEGFGLFIGGCCVYLCADSPLNGDGYPPGYDRYLKITVPIIAVFAVLGLLAMKLKIHAAVQEELHSCVRIILLMLWEFREYQALFADPRTSWPVLVGTSISFLLMLVSMLILIAAPDEHPEEEEEEEVGKTT